MIETALHSRMSGYAGLSALIGTRIYPLHLPQKPVYPCAAYRRTSTKPVNLLSRDTDIMIANFDVAAFSRSADSTFAIAEQIRLCLQRWQGTESGVVIMDSMLTNIDQDYEPDLEIYESELSFEITFRV